MQACKSDAGCTLLAKSCADCCCQQMAVQKCHTFSCFVTQCRHHLWVSTCESGFCSRLHPEGAESQLAVHPHGLPPEVSLCGKMEVLDRMLVKLIAAGHKVCYSVVTNDMLCIRDFCHPAGATWAARQYSGKRSMNTESCVLHHLQVPCMVATSHCCCFEYSALAELLEQHAFIECFPIGQA